MRIQEDVIHNIPLLIVEEEERGEKPTLFFYHGVTSAKEHNLHIAYTIAKKGFRVVLPDALYHGVRQPGEGSKDPYLHFWTVVQQSIEEFPHLVEAIHERFQTEENQLFIGGTSMGAITSYGILQQYDWVKHACLFMGAPQYEEFAKLMFEIATKRGMNITEEQKEATLEQVRMYDLSRDVQLLEDRQLYIWHGMEDQTVPYQFAHDFIAQLKASSIVQDKQVTFYPEKGADHKITRSAMLDAANWFEKQVESQNRVTM